ncbi:MAG: DMT family transporter [Alphaproteobacteria bacterium]|jgi:drug/metabolite transporter (DMT)-like permease|nr:DMT family transporter [Alphaproteobacteria bacterium]
MQQISRTMGPAQWTTLIILSILWGGSFFFAEVAITALPPFTIVLLRVGLAALALHIFLLATGSRMPLDLRLWGAFLVMGFLNNAVPFSLLVWGQTQIASSLASILNAMTPIFTVVVAHFLTSDEKMTGGRLAGVLIGFAGVAVMIGPAALAGLGANLLAQIACLGATLSYAFAGVFGRRFARMGVSPVQTAAGQVTASALILLPLSMMVDRPWTLAMPGMEAMASVVALALLSTAVAYILFFRLLASAGATNIMLVTFLVPVSAILLGVTILGERLEPEHFAGMALIGLGLAAIDGRPARMLARRITARSG